MKSTGIVRRLDELGRITLPIELRRNFDVNS
jgi:transcriptional pleiotropic regulator of transition state genes